MNYFYFFFFLLLASFILIKPLAKIISNWIIASEKLTKTGLLTVLIGVVCIVFSIKGLEAHGAENEFWYELNHPEEVGMASPVKKLLEQVR